MLLVIGLKDRIHFLMACFDIPLTLWVESRSKDVLDLQVLVDLGDDIIDFSEGNPFGLSGNL